MVVATAVVAAPATALEDGTDRQLSTTGTLAETSKLATDPDVAVNTRTGESLVVFAANPNASGGSISYGVYGQRLDAAGQPVGPRLNLAGVGEDTDPLLVFPEPSVAYSEASDRWLVVFSIDDQTLGHPNDKFEVWARKVTGAGAVEGGLIQVSETGSPTAAADDAESPSVAWNPDRDEFLVAWSTDVASAEDDTIQVQRVSGTGTVLGSDAVISATAAQDGAEAYTQRPAVAYDAASGRYLVVWYAEPTPDDAFQSQELFGQLLDGRSAPITPVGPDDFRVSFTGAEGDEGANAGGTWTAGGTNPSPDVAWDAAASRFLVAYQGDPATGGLADNEFEAFVQRVTAAGARDGDAVRASETGPNGTAGSNASAPAIAADPVAREAVVVWGADPETGGLAVNEQEILGQRLIGGAPAGADFRIGQTGPDGEDVTDAGRPAIAGLGARFQVVWDAKPGGFKNEIHGDLLHVPVLSVGDAVANEADGVARVPVAVAHVDGAGVPVTAAVSVDDPGGDVTGAPATVTVPAGAAGTTLELPLVHDAVVEPDERIGVTLAAPSGAVLGTSSAAIALADDDRAGAGPAPGTPPAGTPGATARVPAALQVRRVRIRRGRLEVAGSLVARATGSVRIALRAGGRTTRFSVRPRAGRFSASRALPAVQRRRRTGTVTLSYTGDAGVRPASARLVAATRAPALRVTRSVRSGGVLRVAGTIARRARGVVVVRFTVGDRVFTARARITVPRRAARNRWSARLATVPAAGQLDVLHAGSTRRGVAGQLLSRPVA